MSNTFEILFTRDWWVYTPNDGQWYTLIYHYFNLLEGSAWLTFAALAFRRYLKNRNSRIEMYYAFAFFTFGLTDFREAWVQSSWLIWLKLVNLIILFLLRRKIMATYYPNAKIY